MLWIMVDDCSTDDSVETAGTFAEEHDWIVLARMERGSIPPWMRIGCAIDYGIRLGIDIIGSDIQGPEMIGILDADTIVESRYFETLARALSESPKSAIASGLISTQGGSSREANPLPRGCARLYKRTFLEEVGGFRIGLADDSILEIKAFNRERTFVVCSEASGVHRRASSEFGSISAFRMRGRVQYLLGTDTITMIAVAGLFFLSFGVRRSMNFVAGYLGGIKGEYPRVADPEIRLYYSKAWRRFFHKKESRLAAKALLGF